MALWALEKTKSGVCKHRWLPGYHLDDGTFHSNVNTHVCKYHSPRPFLPLFLFSLVKFISMEVPGRGMRRKFALMKNHLPGDLIQEAPMSSKLGALRNIFNAGDNPFSMREGWRVFVECASELLRDETVSEKLRERKYLNMRSL